MMIKRYALIIFAIVLVSILGFLSTYDPQDSTNLFNSNSEINSESIDKISFSGFSTEAVLHKKGESWTINSYPVYEPMLKGLWDSVELFNSAKLII